MRDRPAGDGAPVNAAGREGVEDGAAPLQDLLVIHGQPEVVGRMQAIGDLPRLAALGNGGRRPFSGIGLRRVHPGVPSRFLPMADNIQLGVEHQEAYIQRIFVSHGYIPIPALLSWLYKGGAGFVNRAGVTREGNCRPIQFPRQFT